MEKQKVRTCTQICIDADEHADDLGYLSDLWKEVVVNRYSYPLVELHYIREHIESLVSEMAQRDSESFKKLFL